MALNWSLQHKRDTAANWTANNPTLLAGQLGIETDNLTTTPKFKVGDGTTAWNSLPYFYGGSLSAQDIANVLSVGNDTGGLSLKMNTGTTYYGATNQAHIQNVSGLELHNSIANTLCNLSDSGLWKVDATQYMPNLTASRILSLDSNKYVVTSYTTTGSGTELALSTSPTLTSATVNGINLKRANNICTFGDSQTEGGDYQTQLIGLLGANWNYLDLGVGGDRTEHLLARIQGVLNTSSKYVIVWCGVNDVIVDYSAATIQANLQSIYTTLKNAGKTVIALYNTPFKGYVSWTAGRQTVLDAVNTWINTTAINVDAKLDIYTLVENGASLDYLLPAYDSGDGLHLNATGYNAIGTYIYNNFSFVLETSAKELRCDMSFNAGQDVSTNSNPVFRKIVATDAFYLYSPNSTNYVIKPVNLTSIALNTQNSVFFRVNDSTVCTLNSTSFQVTGTAGLIINNVGNDGKIQFTRTSGNTYSFQHDTQSFYFYNNTTGFTFLRAFNTGRIALGASATATALVHIGAGTATANTAPLKFTSGTNLTTAEAGTMEYNNTFHLTNSDATRRHIATAPNTTKVTAAAPYTNDGYIVINIGGTDFKVMTTA